MERSPIVGPSVWTAADFATPRSWVLELDDAMRGEIHTAFEQIATRNIPWHAITAKDAPLANTSGLLTAMAIALEDGPGFAVLGGFDTDRYSRDEIRTCFCLLSAHLGRVVSQTHHGDRIIDVRDIGKAYDHTSRGYSSNQLLPFHTDGADLAGLFCIDRAARGGESIIVSAPAVYNTLLDENPEVLDVLEYGFFHHRRGEQPPDEGPVSAGRIPVFSFHNGLLHTMYNRNPIEWVVHEGLDLSSDERDALDILDGVLARPELQLRMQMRPGDIQFINNFVTFHSRTEYEDDASHKRHLLRIWLENAASKRTGPTLLDLYAPAESRAGNTTSM